MRKVWIGCAVIVYLLYVGYVLQSAAEEVRLVYGGDRTFALLPTADNSTVGSWTDSDSDGSLFDELDDPPLADGWGNSDDEGTVATSSPSVDSRAVFDVENNAGYSGEDVSINWLAIRWKGKSEGGLAAYTGFVGVGLVLNPGGDYFVYEVDSDWWQAEAWYGGLGAFEPPSWYGTGSYAPLTTNPITGEKWTAAEVDALQLLIDTDVDSSSDADAVHTELAVLVNISNEYIVVPSSSVQSGGGD